MTNKLFSKAGLFALALATLLITGLIHVVFKGVRIDLSEDNLYTLSSGTRNLVKSIETPVVLKLYYSDKMTEGLPPLRNYALRVKELLHEYVQVSSGNLKLEIIDPEPFSEKEDEAASHGLRSVPLASVGKQAYFGLVALGGENGEKKEVISFLHPDKERFIEYDVSNLIYTVSQLERSKVSVISSLPITGGGGGMDFLNQQGAEKWMSFAQLEQLYDVRYLEEKIEVIPKDTGLLILITTNTLSDKTIFAVEQFVLNGGHTLVFMDPYAESERSADLNMHSDNTLGTTNFDKLLSVWGVEMIPNKFVADEVNALSVGSPSGRPVRHLGILGLGKESLNGDDVITASLKTVNVSSAGALKIKDGASISMEPLLSSSEFSNLLDVDQLKTVQDPTQLYKDFQPTGEKYVIAARLSGDVKTAFPKGQPGSGGKKSLNKNDELKSPILKESKESINVIVVTDTDVLTNRLWVQVNNFFGQQMASPFANNADLLVNMADNLLGNADLISIRGRGQFSRPFTKVDEIERRAQANFRNKEEELISQLKATEQKIMELQAQKEGDNAQILSQDQQREVIAFQQEKMKIRKDLRSVQHQLNRDIEQIGSTFKAINIFLIPFLLTLLALWLRTRKNVR